MNSIPGLEGSAHSCSPLLIRLMMPRRCRSPSTRLRPLHPMLRLRPHLHSCPPTRTSPEDITAMPLQSRGWRECIAPPAPASLLACSYHAAPSIASPAPAVGALAWVPPAGPRPKISRRCRYMPERGMNSRLLPHRHPCELECRYISRSRHRAAELSRAAGSGKGPGAIRCERPFAGWRQVPPDAACLRGRGPS